MFAFNTPVPQTWHRHVLKLKRVHKNFAASHDGMAHTPVGWVLTSGNAQPGWELGLPSSIMQTVLAATIERAVCNREKQRGAL
jgi:hypothetical protein